MLNIGQDVYTVCRRYLSPDKCVLYVSRKEIVGINKDKTGQIYYTAGNFRELRFRETEDGEYISFKNTNGREKPVYLKREDALRKRLNDELKMAGETVEESEEQEASSSDSEEETARTPNEDSAGEIVVD